MRLANEENQQEKQLHHFVCQNVEFESKYAKNSIGESCSYARTRQSSLTKLEYADCFC